MKYYYLSSLRYPFSGEGMVRTMIAIPIMWGCYLARWSFVLGGTAQGMIISYMTIYLVKMFQESSFEDSTDEMCEFPDADFLSLLSAGWHFVATVLFSFVPLAAVIFFDGVNSTFVLPSLAFGLIYFPMALIRVLLLNDVMALSPLGWFRSVRKIPLAYAGLVLFFVAVLGLVFFLFLLGGSSLAGLVTYPLIFLILAVMMNICGKFCRKHDERIEW